MDKSWNSIFVKFIIQNEQKAFNALAKVFPVLPAENIRDIIQDAYSVMYVNICKGKIDGPLYPFFFQTCRNLCLKAVNKMGKVPVVGIDDMSVQQEKKVSMEKVEEILQTCNEHDTIVNKKKKLVREVLDDMTQRCRELLWSFYADELSWAIIAGQLGLSNADSAKAAASRCRKTFKDKYNLLKPSLYA